MQIDRTNWIELVLQTFPAFSAQWTAHVDTWNPLLARPFALDLAEFADFAIDTIALGDDGELDRLAIVLESMLEAEDLVVNYSTRKQLLPRLASSTQLAGIPLERFRSKLLPQTAVCWQAVALAQHGDISIHH